MTSINTFPTTTPEQTLPPGCSGENLDERVCINEDKIQILTEKNDELSSEVKTLTTALEELQNQVLILSTRPCSCH